jgi:hypothetical protein
LVLIVVAGLGLSQAALAQNDVDLEELRLWDQAMDAWARGDLDGALSNLSQAYERQPIAHTACVAEMVARAHGWPGSAMVWFSRCEACVLADPERVGLAPVATPHAPEPKSIKPALWWWAGLVTSATLTVGTVALLAWKGKASQGERPWTESSGQAALGLGIGAGAGWAVTLALIPFVFLPRPGTADSAREEHNNSPQGGPPLAPRTETCSARQ